MHWVDKTDQTANSVCQGFTIMAVSYTHLSRKGSHLLNIVIKKASVDETHDLSIDRFYFVYVTKVT